MVNVDDVVPVAVVVVVNTTCGKDKIYSTTSVLWNDTAWDKGVFHA